MKTVFLCAPHKLVEINRDLIKRIKNLGFEVLCAATHSPQNVPFNEMFQTNVALIKKADVFVAVLKDYGKDLTAEVGMVYAWGIPSIGIDYNANDADVMSYYALEQIIKPGELEEALKKFS